MNTLKLPASHSLFIFRGTDQVGLPFKPSGLVANSDNYRIVSSASIPLDWIDRLCCRLTLDSSDAARFESPEEAWAVFNMDGWEVVARLARVQPGVEQKPVTDFFVHARMWQQGLLPSYFDPGGFVGYTEAFDSHWLGPTQINQVELGLPAVDLEVLQQYSDLAVQYLAFLLQSIEQKIPLLLAFDSVRFKSMRDMYKLIAFVRSALPAIVKQHCHLRIRTANPSPFIKCNTQWVVFRFLLEKNYKDNMLVINHDGKCFTGHQQDRLLLLYAEKIVECTLQSPDALYEFSSLFTLEMLHEADENTIEQSVQNIFYLASVRLHLQTDPEKCILNLSNHPNGLTSNYITHLLPQFMPDSVWISAFEKLEQDKTKGNQIPCLLVLLELPIPDVLRTHLIEKIMQLPIAALVSTDVTLKTLWTVELQNGTLSRWRQHSQELKLLAHKKDMLPLILNAVDQKLLGTSWLIELINQLENGDELLHTLGAYMLKDVRIWIQKSTIFTTLIKRLSKAVPPPVELRDELLAASNQLDPLKELPDLIRLASLAIYLDDGVDTSNPIVIKLRQQLPGIDSPDMQRYVVGLALKAEEHMPTPDFLTHPNGTFIYPWNEAMIQLVWGHAERDTLISRLSMQDFLQIILAMPEAETSFHSTCITSITQRLLQDPEKCTNDLIQASWWQYWYEQATLQPSERVVVAMTWLSSTIWQQPHAPPALWESWVSVMADLAEVGLTGHSIQSLCFSSTGDRRPSWNWIHPFAADQIKDLTRLCRDLAVLAELVQTILNQPLPYGLIPSRCMEIFRSHFLWPEGLSHNALYWLTDLTSPFQRKDPIPPDLPQSHLLCVHAGHLQKQALQIRADTVGTALHNPALSPKEILLAANEPDIWQHETFARHLHTWIQQQNMPEALGVEIFSLINAHCSSAPPDVVSPVQYTHPLVKQLHQLGFDRALEFLAPGAGQYCNLEPKLNALVNDLITPKPRDILLWEALFKDISSYQPSDVIMNHPLMVMANKLMQYQKNPQARLCAREKLLDVMQHGEPLFSLLRFEQKMIMPLFWVVARIFPVDYTSRIVAWIATSNPRLAVRKQQEWWDALFQSYYLFTRSKSIPCVIPDKCQLVVFNPNELAKLDADEIRCLKVVARQYIRLQEIHSVRIPKPPGDHPRPNSGMIMREIGEK